jgi:hypothetical protein
MRCIVKRVARGPKQMNGFNSLCLFNLKDPNVMSSQMLIDLKKSGTGRNVIGQEDEKWRMFRLCRQ